MRARSGNDTHKALGYVVTHDDPRGNPDRKEPPTRTGLTLMLVVWFVLGALASLQRHYCSGSDANSAKAGTIAGTVPAGPLSYAGVNPKIARCRCHNQAK
jgi:hypothetical protein